MKQSNESLLSKLDDAKEAKNQALGELKAVYVNYIESQETIAKQRIAIDELKQQLWKYTSPNIPWTKNSFFSFWWYSRSKPLVNSLKKEEALKVGFFFFYIGFTKAFKSLFWWTT